MSSVSSPDPAPPPGGTAWPSAILVVRPGAIGDVLLTLPCLHALRQAYPHARLEAAGNPTTLELLVTGGCLDHVHSIDDARLAPLFVADAELCEKVRGFVARFDLAVSFISDRDGVFATNLRRAGVRRVIAHHPFPPEADRSHIADYLIRSLEPLGLRPPSTAMVLALGEDEKSLAMDYLASRGISPSEAGELAVVHPGSGGAKNWPAERFGELIDWIQEGPGMRVLLVAGPADDAVLSKTRAAVATDPVVVADLPLSQVAAVIAVSRVFVGNDSGITHLAAALGGPTVAIFGPTDPRVWGPRGSHVRIVEGTHAGAPCEREARRACPDQVCLRGIAVEDVKDAVREQWQARTMA